MTVRPEVAAEPEVAVSRVARRRDRKVQDILTAAADVPRFPFRPSRICDSIADVIDLI